MPSRPSPRSAPCPRCGAKNMSHRRACWRCRGALPSGFYLTCGYTHVDQRYARGAARPAA